MGKINKQKKTSLFGEWIRIFLIVLLFPFVCIYLIKRKKSKNKNEFLLEKSQVDLLSGLEFENCLALLFKKMGYEVSLTKKSGDFGADLILKKGNTKTIVQAKCYNHSVGVKAVQEVVSARNYYKIFDAMVVSNQNFSREAQKLALESCVKLVARDELCSLLQKYKVDFDGFEYKYSCLTEQARREIMSKYRYWV